MRLVDKYKRQTDMFIEVCRRLAGNMYVAAYGGNLAWKLDDNLFLITPTQMHKGDIEAEDLVFVNRKGYPIDGKRRATGELPMYLKFFNERPDVVSVIHCHPPYACALAIHKGKNWLQRPLFPEMVTEIGPVPVVPYAEPLTEKLAQQFSPYLPRYDSFIMENHGLITMSRRDIKHTVYMVELLEITAKSVLIALQTGQIKELSQDEVAVLSNAMTARNLPLFGAPGVNRSLVDLYFPD